MTREEIAEAVAPGRNRFCSVKVVVQPRASRSRLCGVYGGELKIALTAPPVDGQANRKLCSFMADLLGISGGRVVLARGASSRHKVLEIAGMTVDELVNKLSEE